MRNLFVVRWLTPSRRTVLSIVAVVIVVFSIFVLVKIKSWRETGTAKELLTGSIQRSPAVSKSLSTDPMAAFLHPRLNWTYIATGAQHAVYPRDDTIAATATETAMSLPERLRIDRFRLIVW